MKKTGNAEEMGEQDKRETNGNDKNSKKKEFLTVVVLVSV